MEREMVRDAMKQATGGKSSVGVSGRHVLSLLVLFIVFVILIALEMGNGRIGTYIEADTKRILL